MKHIITLLLLLVTFTVAAQSYSPCYTDFMAKGNAAYNQGKYSEAKTYYAKAKQCAGGNPAEAQKKINSCDAKIKAQQEAAETKLKAEQEAAEAKRKAEEAKKRPQEFTTNGVTFKMIYVEGGAFTMGCTSTQGSDCFVGETPAHNVTISSFLICETEVTQALWQAVMGSNPSRFKGGTLPVECVSWYDCQNFCNRLNSLLYDKLPTGYRFAIPTEAQWEYAARGGNKSRGYKYCGSNNLDDVAWYRGNSGDKYISGNSDEELEYADNHCRTHPVKSKQANELGLYDMSGNVWEWCLDWCSLDYYSVSPSTNPQGPSSGREHVIRGGSRYEEGHCCRPQFRSARRPGYDERQYSLIGLRIVLVGE